MPTSLRHRRPRGIGGRGGEIYCLRGRARTRANPNKPTAKSATEAGSGTVPELPPVLPPVVAEDTELEATLKVYVVVPGLGVYPTSAEK